MSNDALKPPAGWYPTPDGDQRYWDGSSWLDLPAPSSSSTPAIAPSPRKSRRAPLLIAAIIVGVLVLGGGAAVVWKVVDDSQVAAAEEAAAAKAEADAKAEEKAEADAEARAAAAQETQDKGARQMRADSVTEIEEAVWKMADGHVADGVVEGPIIGVDCSPVNGGSTDDLTEQTTVFECFVSRVDNGDGTMSGYTYNATMNWSTGSYTYGLGAP